MVQVRHLTTVQDELAVNYCQLAVVSTDPIAVTAAFRAGLGATFTFLSDHERRAIRELDIVEQTKPGFEHGLVAVPYSFSLQPDLTIHRIYNGWWFVGRPTLEELRQDYRAILQKCRPDYEYTPPPTT
jgi:peroxiredoxin